MILGYQIIGEDAAQSSQKIVVLHDWFCDSTSYATMLPYLKMTNRTLYFMDLRGYGESMDLQGDYTAKEAAADVMETITELGLTDYHLIGYSMTGLVGQLLCVQDFERLKSFVAVCPVTAKGLPDTPADVFEFMLDAANQNDEKAKAAAHMMTSEKHTDAFAQYKVDRWRETSLSEARMGYCRMFVETNIVDEIEGCGTPTLVLCTEFDHENHRKTVLEESFGKWFKDATIQELPSAGHYPMQETPVAFADALNRWFDKY